MKHKFFILLAGILALFLILLLIKNCQECKDYPCKTEKGYVCPEYYEIKIQTHNYASMLGLTRYAPSDSTTPIIPLKDPDTTVVVKIPYVCNQIIFAPSLASPHEEIMRKYLKCQGFKRDRTCACSDSLELWTYQEPGDANLIEVVKDPPKDASANTIGGLSLNYEINLDYLDTKARDSIPTAVIESNNGNSTIKIGVSDSGVDLDSGSPIKNKGYLWKESNLSNDPCLNPGTFGLSKLTVDLNPSDIGGHGTFINGILIGAAYSNGQNQSKIPFKLELLNIKNSDHNSFSVFDAICGLYFGLEQGVKIFNISWGFLEEKDGGASEIFKLFLRSTPPDVLLVAGTGNYGNGDSPSGVSLDDIARFWPACLAETEPRVISVGALNEKCDGMALFSNYSFSTNRMTLFAPGEKILSLATSQPPNGTPLQYVVGSGTSYATPFVTRKIAGFRSNNIPANEVKTMLQTSSTTMLGIPQIGM